MKNIEKFLHLMGLPATPDNIRVCINAVDEAIDAGRMQKIQRIPEGESFGTAMARKYRPTTHSQEAEFAEEQREVEREAAETESRDLGKGGNVIQPAPPLREMPDSKYAEFYVSFPGSGVDNVPMKMECSQAYLFLESGRLFPPTEAGKLGADLRTKQGILPPKRQPAPGRFVPESEIEKLSIAVDGGYLSDLPFIIRDFLKAIDKEGGQNE